MNESIIQIGDKSYKKVRVVMLSTDNDNPTQVSLLKYKDKLVQHCAGGEFRRYISQGANPQNLYLLSDEEIKEGEKPEWVYESEFNMVMKPNWDNFDSTNCKKVIATNDRNLTLCTNSDHDGNVICNCNKLPRPSNDFLEAFVREWNKGNKIEEVLVEIEPKEYKAKLPKDFMNYIHPGCGMPVIAGSEEIISWKMKIAQDNTITIRAVEKENSLKRATQKKQMFTREEVIDIIGVYAYDVKEGLEKKISMLYRRNWFNENY